MSLSALRRFLIAASSVLAVGGSLALAASASAVELPLGTATDSSSSTLYGLYNQATDGLVLAGTEVLPGIDMATGGAYGTDAYAAVTASTLTGAQVSGIGAALEAIPSAVWAAIESDPSLGITAADVANLETAAASWSPLQALITNLGPLDVSPFQSGLFTVDGDLALSSSTQVTAAHKPAAYTVSLGTTSAAVNGYVLPTAYTLTLPSSGFAINAGLSRYELNANGAAAPGSATLEALEAAPPMADQIGTVSLTSPLSEELLQSPTPTANGGIFLINANGNAQDPDLELYLGSGDYILGQFSSLSQPITVTFGEANLSVIASALTGSSTLALPLSNVTLSFSAGKSPLVAQSCSAAVGPPSGTATDEVASLAPVFGDTGDAGAVSLQSSTTAVSDLCAPSASGAHISGIRTGSATVSLTLKGNGGTPFDAAVITLPHGLSAKHLKATGAERSVRVNGQRVTVVFKRSHTSASLALRGLKVTPALRSAITAKKTRALSLEFEVDYRPAGAAIASTSASGSVSVRKLS
ncbi:MAG TPA: hypothetical protein VME01_02005 [Solirubrobacteraceae bacterium]|nr:hypothetical protein [Solirubrobacteraceae bacterium]